MKILSLSVQGFRSFVKEQEVNFATMPPGLYHLAGRNEVEPELEGNGAGKSSLLEALCWGLYGRTSRNLRASAVKSWGSKEKCAVILHVQTAAGEVSIFRVWNPNTLEVAVNGGQARPVDQKALDELLGVSPEAFLFSIYFAQFTPAFIDLRPAEQMSVYSAVLGLDLWANAADVASKRGRELEALEQRSREACARLEGQVKELEGLNFEADERAWDKAQRDKVRQVSDEINVLVPKRTAAEAEVARLDKEASASRQARDEEAKLAAELRQAQRNLEAATQEHKKMLASAKQGKCPLCGSEMSKKHAEVEVARLQTEVDKWLDAVEKLQKKHTKAKEQSVGTSDIASAWSSAVSMLERLRASARELESRLGILNREVNPFKARREENEAKLAKLNTEAEREVASLEKTSASKATAVFWSKGFKELRLSLIEESLAQLSVEANAALVGLGLRAWSLGFDVERETKSGGVSKGFTVAVGAPHVRETVPWEAWSGGESQRLRVAASLGFGELICSRMGLQPNLELWDEPSTWLSEAGIQDLLAALEDRARSKGKVIILADHRALDFGGFRGVIQVVKTAAGSRVSYNY